MKNILVIQGHPDPESYCEALGQAYVNGAKAVGAEVDLLNVRDLDFSPNLSLGYRKRTELEPDLLSAQEKIKRADHVILIHPLWWGGLPAITKGFFDRLFLPGFAFQKREGSLFWNKLLKGKTARIITTMDQPNWFYRFINRAPSYFAIKKMTFEFVGFKSVKITGIGPIRLSTEEFRTKWIKKVYKLGEKLR